MKRLIGQLILTVTLFCGFGLEGEIRAEDWTKPTEVYYDVQRCVSYRAKLAGEFLMIQAAHEAGWHTYAMDNKLRAQEKLAGKRSLGIDRPTEIVFTEGLELTGPWYQSVPKDFSKPELRWYTWGFEGQSLFVAKVRRTGPGSAKLSIRGQACAESICKDIDVTLSIPPGNRAGKPDVDLKTLIQVR